MSGAVPAPRVPGCLILFLTVFVAVEVISTLIDVSSIRTKWAEVVFPGCSESLRTGVQLRLPSLSVVSVFFPDSEAWSSRLSLS